MSQTSESSAEYKLASGLARIPSRWMWVKVWDIDSAPVMVLGAWGWHTSVQGIRLYQASRQILPERFATRLVWADWYQYEEVSKQWLRSAQGLARLEMRKSMHEVGILNWR